MHREKKMLGPTQACQYFTNQLSITLHFHSQFAHTDISLDLVTSQCHSVIMHGRTQVWRRQITGTQICMLGGRVGNCQRGRPISKIHEGGFDAGFDHICVSCALSHSKHAATLHKVLRLCMQTSTYTAQHSYSIWLLVALFFADI